MPKTIILSTEHIDLQIAAKLLKEGKLVAFPTETVYGLGANALDEKAVSNIFVAKGRPQDNPLIVHIYDEKQLTTVAQEIPPLAKQLIKAFWPGPLTIILKKQKHISKMVTAGLDSVAIRMPNHPVALQLLQFANIPVVAPSANTSGKPSPTKAEHVMQDLNEIIEGIVDGGQTEIGIESTVIDLTSTLPTILRKGKITKEQIEKIIGTIEVSSKKEQVPKAPGMKYKHYSPQAKVIIVTQENHQQIQEQHKNKKTLLLEYASDQEMAHQLFKDFREADKENYEIILVKETTQKGLGEAIMDRLKKASENGY